MPTKFGSAAIFAVLACLLAGNSRAANASAETGLTADQLVQVAFEANPQIKAARARWLSAVHSVKQNYAPADPIFGYYNIDSPSNGFSQASEHSLTVTDSFQFPGKGLLQANEAKRSAEVARLTYQAMMRDIRAQIETAYYQALLDGALEAVEAETVASLEQVLKVTQVGYATGQATQSDFIGAEFDLAIAQVQQRQLRVAEENDETTINQLLYRAPDEPLNLDRKIELAPMKIPLDELINRAAIARQEILEAALAQKNVDTSLELAKLEYAPDYTLGYTFDNYLLSSAAPAENGRMQDHGWSIEFNVPIFYWLKQNEDVKKAGYDLEAAHDDLGAIRSQTSATVTTLYRTAQFAYQTAVLYRDSLIPLARQDFVVSLTAYQSGKIDFTTLANTVTAAYSAHSAYLQAANQFLAGKVALEQAIGEPF
ncbi:MAG TPA: TolC family protein [Candidatus Binataceae bacterium]|nr:TolC family protein [Candidatus Binataceae bacterium]